MELTQFIRNRHYKKRYTDRGGLYLIVLDSCTAACPGYPSVKIGQTRRFIDRFVAYARAYKACLLVALCVVPRHCNGDRIRALESAVTRTLKLEYKIRAVFMQEWYERNDFATVKRVLLTIHRATYPNLHRWVRNISREGFDKIYHNPSSINPEECNCHSAWTARLRSSE